MAKESFRIAQICTLGHGGKTRACDWASWAGRWAFLGTGRSGACRRGSPVKPHELLSRSRHFRAFSALIVSFVSSRRISPGSGRADRWVLLSRHPCLPCCRWRYGQQGPFAPRALPRFLATTSPSATLSSSADFPVLPVIRLTPLPPFRVGTRRASPVARCARVAVLSLITPPE